MYLRGPLTLCPTSIPRARLQERENKRTVIVTSFGIHDASPQLQASRRKGLDSFHAAALATCRDATAQLTHQATTGDPHLAPLVFLLQNSVVEPGGVDQVLLDEVHRVQREEIGFGRKENTVGVREMGRETERRGQGDGVGDEYHHAINDRGGAGGDNQVVHGETACRDERHGVFLVEDVGSKLQCNGQDTSRSFLEYVKVEEAKMFWDLIALADRGGSPPLATSQFTGNGTVEAVEPSWVVRATDARVSGPSVLGADAVWSRLQEASSLQDECVSPPCGNVSSLW